LGEDIVTLGSNRHWLAVLGLCMLLAACGTGRTIVMEPPQKKAFSAVTLARADDTVAVPEEYRARFVAKLREQLYGTKDKPGPFAEGAGLTIRIKVVQFSAGNQFERWFWGGIGNAGEGSLQVLAEFYDGDRKLAQTQTEGRIGSGFLGGSMNEAVDKAAEEIARYAAAHFR
jgi:hypothetical protein